MPKSESTFFTNQQIDRLIENQKYAELEREKANIRRERAVLENSKNQVTTMHNGAPVQALPSPEDLAPTEEPLQLEAPEQHQEEPASQRSVGPKVESAKYRNHKYMKFIKQAPKVYLSQLYKKVSGRKKSLPNASKEELFHAISQHDPSFRTYIKRVQKETAGESKISKDKMKQIFNDFEPSQMGLGLVDGKPGLFNSEVMGLMDKFKSKGFLGTFSID